MAIVVATFYKFVRLSDAVERQISLQTLCETRGVRGTILLAGGGNQRYDRRIASCDRRGVGVSGDRTRN